MTETSPPRQTPPRSPSRLRWFLAALLILLAAVLLVSTGVVTLPGDFSDGDYAQLVYLLIILAFIASAFFGRRLGAGEVVRGTAAWLAIFLVLLGAYAYQNELMRVGGRLLGVLAPGIPVSGRLAGGDVGDTSVMVVRGASGHFAVRTDVNDTTLTLMLDTGASFVTLTPDDAERVGINLAGLRYELPIRTANGVIRAAPIRIEHMAVGDIERRNVPALVSPPGALDQSLLGMSFLDTLHGYAISGDRLVLTP